MKLVLVILVNGFKLLLAEQKVDVNWVSSDPVNVMAFGRAWHGMGSMGELTALMISSASSNFEATKLLLDDERVDLNWENSMTGFTVLHKLVTLPKVNLKLLEMFLAHPRVDVNGKCGSHGITILHTAAALCRNVEVVKLIQSQLMELNFYGNKLRKRQKRNKLLTQ